MRSSFKTVLYVFEAESNLDLLIQRNRAQTVAKYVLCPLTTDLDFVNAVADRISSQLSPNTNIVPFATHFNQKALDIRDSFIKFISDLGNTRICKGENLKEYFKPADKGFSLWWLSLISAKNPVHSDSFHNLVKLLTIVEIINQHKCDEIWLDIASREVSLSLSDYAVAAGRTAWDLRGHKNDSEVLTILTEMWSALVYFKDFMAQVIWSKTSMSRWKERKKKLETIRWLLVTYFPFVDREKWRDQQFVDKYYEPLQMALEKRGKEQIAWLGIGVDTEGFGFRNTVQMGQRVNQWGNTFFWAEEWLKLWDIREIIGLYVRSLLRFLRRRSFFSEIRYQDGAISIKLWPLFKNDWYRSFCGTVLLQGILFYNIFRRVLGCLGTGTIVTYIAEMHAWEKALNIAARERPGLKTIGIQHTQVPLFLLNYFYHNTELADSDYVQTVPKPDYLACVGSIPMMLLEKNGWPTRNLFRLGAIRFQHYKELLANPIPWTKRDKVAIVALTIDSKAAREVLSLVYEAFHGRQGYKIVIKGHPFRPVPPLATSLGIELNRPPFEIVDVPLMEVLPRARVMIVAGSSASLEALACGCAVVIPRLASVVDLSPLSGVTDLPVYADNAQELRQVVDGIMAARESPISFDKCYELIHEYFDLLDSDEEFLGRLETRLASEESVAREKVPGASVR